jgi:Ca-activated chloride channel homolog
MRTYTHIFRWIIAIIVMLISQTVYADGFIIPIRPPNVERVPLLSLKYHRVTVEIEDQVALTKVDQVFVNEFHRELEGTYIFPLPKGANITDFAMYINGERISGELLERDKARRIYQEIVNQMKDPALLEYFDRDLFKIRVYPIPARGEKRIQLEYTEVLKSDNGMVRYHYPLDTERFSAKPLKEVSIAATIRSQQPLKSIYSPSHDVAIDRKNDQWAVVGYEDTHILPDKDFVVYYTVADDPFGVNLLTYKKSRSDGYFMLMVSPGYEVEDYQVLPKDIVFVLDTSGSMRRDGKMRQAQDALVYGIEGLNPDDRFGLVTFSTSVNTFDDVLLKGTQANIDAAIEFVEDLRARGGTDIYEALKTALDLLEEDAEHPQMVVFLTDGRPTVGMTEYTEILRKIGKHNSQRNRLFTFGVGYDVNAHLLDALSEESKAASAYIEPEEDLEVIVSNFFDKIDAPVLADLDVKIAGAGVFDVFPKELPDLFRGSQLLVMGRYRHAGDFDILLSGVMDDRQQVSEYAAEFPQTALSHDFLPRIWASRKIGYLLDQIRLHGEEQELKEEVIELAKKFGIVTPYTSYLVTEDEEIEGDRRRPRPRPLFESLAPATGTSRAVSGGAAHEMYNMDAADTPAMTPGFTEHKEGEVAVRVSKDVQQLKQQAVVSDEISSDIRFIGDKTFYFIQDVWTDSSYMAGDNTISIVYGSDAYFALLAARPDLGKYLSVGERMILCLDGGDCLQIGTTGIRDADDTALSELLYKLR